MHLKVFLSPLLKKPSKQLQAFILHHSRFGLRLGMQHVAEAREAIFRVVGCPYDFADMGMTEGTGAHGAWFQSDI